MGKSIDEALIWLLEFFGGSVPMASIDIESTGVNPTSDRIIQLGVVKVYPARNGEPAKVVRFRKLFDPLMPISPGATAIHGITDAMVSGQSHFAAFAGGIAAGLEGCIVVGYSSTLLDLPMLRAEFERAGLPMPVFIGPLDPYVLWMKRAPRDQAAAVAEFWGEDSREAAHHDALFDAESALMALFGQVARWGDELGASVDVWAKESSRRKPEWFDEAGKVRWEDGAARVSFGKHRGVALQQIPRDWFEWAVGPKADFSADVREIFLNALNGKFPDGPPAI